LKQQETRRNSEKLIQTVRNSSKKHRSGQNRMKLLKIA